MSSFMYFIPRIVNAADAGRIGLAYAFAGPPNVTLIERGAGPEGLSGTVLHLWAGPTLPERIEWWRIEEELWLGWHPAAIPGPLQLRRSVEITAGIQVRLRDGQQWTVPRVLPCCERDPQRADGLPRLYTLDEDGTPRLSVPAEYDELIIRCQRFLDAWRADRLADLPPPEPAELAAGLLAVGYRISLRELLALELLEQASTRAICHDAIDALERIKADSPARVTARLDEVGVMTWLEWQGLQTVMRERGDG